MKSKILIISILLIGFLSRFLLINQLPPSLNWDEVSHGYNAYSILKTGKDEWGITLPTIFRCFGDFKLPLYIYLTVLPVSILGLNPLSIRLISILAGNLTPLIVYLILKKISSEKKFTPIIGLIITTFSPATIFLSRIALEANLFMFLFCISFYFLIDKKYGWSSFIFSLSLFTYNSSRVLLPFYLITLIYFIIKNKFNLKREFYKFLPLILLIGLALFQTLNQSGQARYQWVSILDSGSINHINELRQTYPRFLVNKGTYFIFTAAKNYLAHFNPQFLFFKGGSHYQFSLPSFYLISPLFIPFLLLGLIFILKNFKQPEFQLILFYWLVSPIPSSITRDAPHILRSIIFIPFTILIISLGFIYLLKKHSKISFFYLLVALLISQFSFWPKYLNYSKEYSSSWQYGYKEAVTFVKDNYTNYPQIIFTKKYGEAHEFVLFYWPWNPILYQNDQQKNWDYHANWYWINAFDKFKFVNDWEIQKETKDLTSKTLLVTSPNNYNPKNSNLLKTIYFSNGDIAFEILEINP